MNPPSDPPAVFYIRNRVLILVAFPPIALFSLTRIFANLGTGEPWLNWLAGLVLWIFVFFLALRRRLVFGQSWLEYRESFTSTRIPWAQVTRVVSHRVIGIWPVEGLEVWTAAPGLNQGFIDLTQFSRSWRQGDLGKLLRAKAPHLFLEPAPW